MNPLASVLDTVRRLDLEQIAGLRPDYPPVALEMNRREMVLVRVRRRRRGRPELEAQQLRPMPDHGVGASIFRPNLGSPEEVSRRLKELLEVTGTRPGRISLVLPDNLAKVSIVTLPERPASRKQLDELIRFKLRRSVPFRLEDAVISHQVLPTDGKEISILVALMLRSVVEQYEQVLEAAGTRPGLVDLATPSLFNLCRSDVEKASREGRDVAVVNCSDGYFALILVRGGQIIFYRCKSYGAGDEEVPAGDTTMARELATSLSYYQEKLSGQGIAATYLRSVSHPLSEVAAVLERVGFGEVRPIDPAGALAMAAGLRLDGDVGQRLAPALGAAAGRGE